MRSAKRAWRVQVRAEAFAAVDPVIHERARTGIVSLLAASRELSFNELKAMLGLTDGNLSVHLRVLEARGYVEADKAFVDRKPRTTLRLTATGRRAFERYIEALERMTRAGGV